MQSPRLPLFVSGAWVLWLLVGLSTGRAAAVYDCSYGCACRLEPVCGKRGRSYMSPCVAHCAGDIVKHVGYCEGEKLQFDACGAATGAAARRERQPLISGEVMARFAGEGFTYLGRVALSGPEQASRITAAREQAMPASPSTAPLAAIANPIGAAVGAAGAVAGAVGSVLPKNPLTPAQNAAQNVAKAMGVEIRRATAAGDVYARVYTYVPSSTTAYPPFNPSVAGVNLRAIFERETAKPPSSSPPPAKKPPAKKPPTSKPPAATGSKALPKPGTVPPPKQAASPAKVAETGVKPTSLHSSPKPAAQQQGAVKASPQPRKLEAVSQPAGIEDVSAGSSAPQQQQQQQQQSPAASAAQALRAWVQKLLAAAGFSLQQAAAGAAATVNAAGSGAGAGASLGSGTTLKSGRRRQLLVDEQQQQRWQEVRGTQQQDAQEQQQQWRRQQQRQASAWSAADAAAAAAAATGSSNATVAHGAALHRQLSVIGPDSRKPCPLAAWPYSALGQITSLAVDGDFLCSGGLIGEDRVLTAAHCVWDDRQARTFFKDLSFAPGQYKTAEGRVREPLGVVEWDYVTIFQQYADDPNYLGLPYDVAVIRLKKKIGSQLGWLGYRAACDTDPITLHLAGYPGDNPSIRSDDAYLGGCYADSCSMRFDCKAGNNNHTCDSYVGQSGAPMWDKQFYVRMVHTLGVLPGFSDTNAGVTITKFVLDNISKW